jgi:hypothetical protein
MNKESGMQIKMMVLVLLTGCLVRAESQVISNEVLDQWGYEVNTRMTYLVDFCAMETTPSASHYQSIRAKVATADGVRSRYTLAMEVYPSAEVAGGVIEFMKDPPHRSSKHAKLCDIRLGFQLDNTVYFIHSEFSGQTAEMTELFGLFKAGILVQVSTPGSPAVHRSCSDNIQDTGFGLFHP